MAKKKLSDQGKEIFHAKDYRNRRELDDNIRVVLGINGNNKDMAIIKGSKKQLLKLYLSEDTTVYNVGVQIT